MIFGHTEQLGSLADLVLHLHKITMAFDISKRTQTTDQHIPLRKQSSMQSEVPDPVNINENFVGMQMIFKILKS